MIPAVLNSGLAADDARLDSAIARLELWDFRIPW